MNSNGFNLAIKTPSRAPCVILTHPIHHGGCRSPADPAPSPRTRSKSDGRGGGGRTPRPRFLGPTARPLGYTPVARCARKGALGAGILSRTFAVCHSAVARLHQFPFSTTTAVP